MHLAYQEIVTKLWEVVWFLNIRDQDKKNAKTINYDVLFGSSGSVIERIFIISFEHI